MTHNVRTCCLLLSAYCLLLSGVAGAQEAPPGEPQQGVRAVIAMDRAAYTTRDPIALSMTLTNVGDRAVVIDPWEGNWFVQVYDDAFVPLQAARRPPAARRPMVEAMRLAPGASWTATTEGLKLFTRLPDPFVLWAYPPLPPGTYWLGAEYWALPEPSHSEIWSGLVRSELVRVELHDD